MPAPALTRRQVNCFRLARHGLSHRLPADRWMEALADCPLQDSPPGTTHRSLHARVVDLDAEVVEASLTRDRATAMTWSMRAAPHLMRLADWYTFTHGLLAAEPEEQLYFVMGVTGHLERLSLPLTQALELSDAALPEALSGKRLSKDALGKALATAVEPHLTRTQASLWREPDGWRENTHGETVVHFMLNLLSARGRLCLLLGRRATEAVLAEEWLPPMPEAPSSTEATAELLRSYLRHFGPSTPTHFAQWTGAAPSWARHAWARLEEELAPVTVDGRRASALTADLPVLTAAELPEGVRLVPAYDPYLQARDKATLVPDAQWRRAMWRTVGNPGAVLSDGEIVGLWRARQAGRRWRVTVEGMAPLPQATRRAVLQEAEGLARVVGQADVEVAFA